jgi:hypothetical protein
MHPATAAVDAVNIQFNAGERKSFAEAAFMLASLPSGHSARPRAEQLVRGWVGLAQQRAALPKRRREILNALKAHDRRRLAPRLRTRKPANCRERRAAPARTRGSRRSGSRSADPDSGEPPSSRRCHERYSCTHARTGGVPSLRSRADACLGGAS